MHTFSGWIHSNSFFNHSLHVLLVPAVHVFVILDRWLWPKKSSLPRQFLARPWTQQLLLASTESPIGNLRTHYKDIIAIFSYGFAIGIAGNDIMLATSKRVQETAVGEAKVEDRPRSSQQAAKLGRCPSFVCDRRWQASVTYLETLKIYQISGVVFQCWVVKQLVLTAHPLYVSGCCQRVCLFSDKGTTGGQTLYTCATSLGSEECHESDNFAWCLPVIL